MWYQWWICSYCYDYIDSCFFHESFLVCIMITLFPWVWGGGFRHHDHWRWSLTYFFRHDRTSLSTRFLQNKRSISLYIPKLPFQFKKTACNPMVLFVVLQFPMDSSIGHDTSAALRGRWTSSTRSLDGCPGRSALPECGRQQEGAESRRRKESDGISSADFLSKYDDIFP